MHRGRRLLLLSLPATVVAGLLSVMLVETWVRLQWDEKRGTPGFFLADPVRGNRLAPGYRGFFAGVPVHINALGFRDRREYNLEKSPGTFRILVLGDSVTFGHGTLDETTYPFLLEQRLREWRPDVNWEVWNLGVPGYNTSQELAYLTEVETRYDPDLAIVGFFANDLTENTLPAAPSLSRRATRAVQRLMQQHLYSYELYKRIFLTARWRLMTDDDDRRRVENLSGEEALLGRVGDLSADDDQKLGAVDTFDDQQVRDFTCPVLGPGDGGGDRLAAVVRKQSPETLAWLAAVRGLQQMNRTGAYRVMFFINMAPDICSREDRFHNGGSLDDDDALREILGDGTPVASSTRAFLRYRPSQMPGANNHSFGNANRVKADALFEFLRTSALLPTAR